MTGKRFKMKKLEYEVYFIDSQQEYVDEDEPNFKIDGEKTMSDSQILDLLNENEQLKKELDKLKVVNEMLSIDFSNSEHELWRENKQLKHNNRMLSRKMSEVYTKYRLLKEFSEDTNPNDAVKKVLSELMQITKEYR